MDEKQIQKAISESLSHAVFYDAQRQAVWERVKGEKPMKKRNLVALVCGVVLTLALAGMALASALGVFGQLAAIQEEAQTAQRMQKLDENADMLNQQVSLEAPASAAPATEVDTTGQMILNHLQERRFELTLSQTYYDGTRLYYAYTLKTGAPSQCWQGEGQPTGVSEWLMEETGKRYEQVWSHEDAALDQTIQSWLNHHSSSWIAFESWSLGDGAATTDGTDLPVVNAQSWMVDSCTLQGYQEVELPEELVGSDWLEMELCVLYGASLYHQDETGVRWAHFAQPENRGILRIPFTVRRNGQLTELACSARFESYQARASLQASDVDIHGKVVLSCPGAWTDTVVQSAEGASDEDVIINYHLMADDTMARNLEGSLSARESGVLEISVRFDLPKELDGLTLVPEYALAGFKPEEAIWLQPQW